jgi:hypothetical protein
MMNRIAALICFLDPQDAAAGMQILAGLGYRSVVLPEIVDEGSDATCFVEASRSVPEGADISDRWRFDCAALDEVQDAIDHLGDVSEVGLAGDEKIDWCGGCGMTKRAATWRSASIHTPRELARKGRRLDHVNSTAERVIAAMRRGASLHRTHRPNSTRWALNTGMPVSDEVARAVISRGDVVGVGDSLFDRGLSQTWRFTENTGGEHV